MTWPVFPRLLPALMALFLLGGCAAIAGLDAASTPLESFDLTTPTGSGGIGGGGPTLYVEQPAAGGALNSELIAVRPSPLQVVYLPGVRWSDGAPDLMRGLLVRTLSGTGSFALVSGAMGGPRPDLVLFTEIEAFEAVVTPPSVQPDGQSGGQSGAVSVAPVQVVVRVTLALTRDSDRSLVAARQFEQRVAAASDSAGDIVRAFDAANGALLRAAASWVAAASRGAV